MGLTHGDSMASADLLSSCLDLGQQRRDADKARYADLKNKSPLALEFLSAADKAFMKRMATKALHEPFGRRRLDANSVMSDHDAPCGAFIFVPILLILMLVFFMHRRRIQDYFSGAVEKPFNRGLRSIQKKSPHMPLSY